MRTRQIKQSHHCKEHDYIRRLQYTRRQQLSHRWQDYDDSFNDLTTSRRRCLQFYHDLRLALDKWITSAAALLGDAQAPRTFGEGRERGWEDPPCSERIRIHMLDNLIHTSAELVDSLVGLEAREHVVQQAADVRYHCFM